MISPQNPQIPPPVAAHPLIQAMAQRSVVPALLNQARAQGTPPPNPAELLEALRALAMLRGGGAQGPMAEMQGAGMPPLGAAMGRGPAVY